MSKALRAVVVCVSEARKEGRAQDMREVLQIANKLVKMREKSESEIPILEVVYVPRVQAYVCIYERMGVPRALGRRGVHRKNE